MPKVQTQDEVSSEDRYADMKCGLCGYKYRIAKEDLFSVIEGKDLPYTFEETCPYCFKPNGTWTATQDGPTATKVVFLYAPVPRKEICQVTVNMPKTG